MTAPTFKVVDFGTGLWLVSDDADQPVGAVETVSAGVFEAYLGDVANGRPIGLADTLEAAVEEVTRIHQADQLVTRALRRGKRRGRIGS